VSELPLNTKKELLLLIGKGNQKAFEALFRGCSKKVFSIAYQFTFNRESSEEIVQDVFLKIWLKRNSIQEITDFDSWLFIITRNTIYNFLKAKSNKELEITLNKLEWHGILEDADSKVKEKELQTIINEAVKELPPQQQQVYHLSVEVGLKKGEIATYMNIAPETAKKHLQYAMRRIRVYLLSKM
jgi:RNA polymerase sigma-70 factor (ECF subfamily)